MYQTKSCNRTLCSFRLDNDVKDTLVEEIENDDLIVSVDNVLKAAPLNVFVQDKLANAVLDDTREDE